MSFSWKRAGKHMGLAALVLLIGGAAAVAATHPKDPEKLGEACAKPFLVLLLVVLGVSWLVQNGRKKAAGLVVGGVLAVIGAVVVVALAERAHAAPRLSPMEKEPLDTRQIGGAARLVHPGLGFSVLSPGGATTYEALPSSLVDASFDKDLDVHGYAYFDTRSDGVGVLMILETSSVPGSRADLVRMMEGVKASLVPNMKTLTGADPRGLKTEREDLSFRDGAAEAETHYTDGKAHLRVDMHTVKHGEVARLVILVGLTQADDSLAAVLSSFQTS